MITVVIADDQPTIVASLSAILSAEPDIDVVATAHTGPAAVDAVALHQPDVILLDVRMPGGDGISALADMSQRNMLGIERTKAIVLTTFDLDEYVEAALRAGASGFLVKTVSFEQLLVSVRAVAGGEGALAPAATRRLLSRYLSSRAVIPSPKAQRRVECLTPRERDVLRLIGRGRSNSEVAEQLVVSHHTVKTHFSSILAKTGCRDRAEAIVLAYDAGLVEPGSRN
ncbi:response regulator transcription factor [Salinibacterium sp.]|uniref:response regulator transcription factor n=1 Tax=Salinibacterium sp. TaxID=1915057 RepID=UPI00286CA07A|nr:response regulator transcription factor [Salinibacterium sp.]